MTEIHLKPQKMTKIALNLKNDQKKKPLNDKKYL